MAGGKSRKRRHLRPRRGSERHDLVGEDADPLARSHGFLHHVLDGGLVHQREHLLGLGLGGREEAGPEPRGRKHGLPHAHPPPPARSWTTWKIFFGSRIPPALNASRILRLSSFSISTRCAGSTLTWSRRITSASPKRTIPWAWGGSRARPDSSAQLRPTPSSVPRALRTSSSPAPPLAPPPPGPPRVG